MYSELQPLLSDFPLNQADEIPKEKLIFSDEVRAMCEQNYCGSYGRCWVCPPGVGPVAEWKERILSFRHTALFNYVGRLEDSYDLEGMAAAGDAFHRIVRGIKKALGDAGADCLVLGAGGCTLCPTCSFPDAPCRFPAQAIPSVEACGLYISRIAPRCGFRYINGPNTVTYFGLIAFN